MLTLKVEKLDPKSTIKYQCCRDGIAAFKLSIGLNKDYLCEKHLYLLQNQINKALSKEADVWETLKDLSLKTHPNT